MSGNKRFLDLNQLKLYVRPTPIYISGFFENTPYPMPIVGYILNLLVSFIGMVLVIVLSMV